MASAQPAVRIDSLEKRYASGTLALKGVSFDVDEGEFFGLLGPNGAGKTTLISCLGGLTTPTGGRILVRGMDTRTDRRAASLFLGIVPQEITFDPFLTVRETLRFQSGYWGILRNDDWIDEILANLGLTDKADASMRALSGGMKRRVLVAQALVHKPPVIVLDEPTAMLDPNGRKEVIRTVHELNRAEGITMVLITHYMEEVVDADRVIVMDDGHIVMDGTPKEIFSRVEELKQYRMDVPQVTELAWELQKKGIPLPDGILRKSELLDALVPLLKEE